MRLLLLLPAAWILAAAPQDTVTLSPALLNFSGKAGADLQNQNITVKTVNGSWKASAGAPWLRLSQDSGTGSATVSVGVSTSGLPPGIYSGKVQVEADGTPSAVSVTLAVAAAAGAASSGNNWYISPTGTPDGDGSIDYPWDIVTGFNKSQTVQPGDTVWLRDGKYGDGGANTVIANNFVGKPDAPVIVRAYPGERPIIDAWLQVGCCDQGPNPAAGAYTWFWGLEFASYNPDRHSGTSGPPEWAAQANHSAVDAWAPGTRIINCVIHDTAGGISLWDEASDAEAYGNIVYNVGGYGTDRGHGHGFYMQNAAPGYKHIFDNISFNNFGEGMQMYGTGLTYVQNFHLEGNVAFNNGAPGLGKNAANGTAPAGDRGDNLLVGAGNGGPAGIVLLNNYTYHTPLADDGYNHLSYNSTPVANDLTAMGNYFIGGREAVEIYRWNSVVFRNNTLYSANLDEISMFWRDEQNPSGYGYDHNRYFGSGRFTVYAGCITFSCSNGRTLSFNQWRNELSLDANSTFTQGAPSGVWSFVRPNLYEPGRANIIIYNWDLQPAVQVDLSGSGINVGDQFQIRDAENWFGGALVSGTYTGDPVAIPMTGLVVALPNGVVPNPQPHTAPQFGAFVLLSGAAMNVYEPQVQASPDRRGGGRAPSPMKQAR